MHEELDLVVVANRLPVHRVDCGDDATWETSPGGLVSARGVVVWRHVCPRGSDGALGYLWGGVQCRAVRSAWESCGGSGGMEER